MRIGLARGTLFWQLTNRRVYTSFLSQCIWSVERDRHEQVFTFSHCSV